MIIGVPKEIKDNENRVALTPAGAMELVKKGHQVRIEKGAGEGSGFKDNEYLMVGATIVKDAAEAWKADLVLKVKEPLPQEFGHFREHQMLFTFLHLAAAPALTDALLQRKVTAIAYETIQLADGSLPLLTPMSEVAGRMAVQAGAQFLEAIHGGRGMLLGGVPGVPPAEVVIIGGGVVGTNAARIALGLGARVTILEKSLERMRYLEDIFQGRAVTFMSNPFNIEQAVKRADLLIGAVLIPGAKAPKLVTEEMVKQMKKGAVIVDVAVDQGGIIETIDRATSHSNPTYMKHGVVHYAVANIPGAVPRTSTFALTHATLPYVIKLADLGLMRAVESDSALRLGVNVYNGSITHPQIAAAFNKPHRSIEEVLPVVLNR